MDKKTATATVVRYAIFLVILVFSIIGSIENYDFGPVLLAPLAYGIVFIIQGIFVFGKSWHLNYTLDSFLLTLVKYLLLSVIMVFIDLPNLVKSIKFLTNK